MAARLPKELADDVVGSVLDCFRYVRRSKGDVFLVKSSGCSFSLSFYIFFQLSYLSEPPKPFCFPFEVKFENSSYFCYISFISLNPITFKNLFKKKKVVLNMDIHQSRRNLGSQG